MLTLNDKRFQTAYANDVAALKPSWWALEGLAVLEEELVVANLVNKDYSNFFVNAGDTVHVNKAGTFSAKHKVAGSDTTVQDAEASDTTVKLNQHLHVTFLLDDKEMAQSMPDLREYFLLPAVRGIAEGIDKAISGEAINFIGSSAGILGTALTAPYVIGLGKEMDNNNVPVMGRNLVVGPAGKADLLGIDRYADTDKSGAPSKFLTGRIGEIMGMPTYMSQSVGAVLPDLVTTTAEAIGSANIPIGTTGVTVVSATGTQPKGSAVKIAGVQGIYYLTTALGNTDTTMYVTPGLKSVATAAAVVTIYESAIAAVDNASNYAAGEITIITDGYTSAAEIPVAGQCVSFGGPTTATWYTVTSVSGTWVNNTTDITITLNRPLDAGITDGDLINVSPTGGAYNFALRRDAITLVNRPLAPASAGVDSVVRDNGQFALRVTVGYDYRKMRHFVTVDTLIGVKTLDAAQGALLFN